MKTGLLLLVALYLAGRASAATIVDQDWTVNTAIPQGNLVGIALGQTFTGLAGGPITGVSVALDITGGYNGFLYGYLTLRDANGHTATEVLLNQIGTSSSNPFGSSGAGMDVILSDSGTANGSIHNATGVPTGIWQPDSASTLDGTFGGMTADGTWTLYLADEATGGGTSTLLDWGLQVDANPVPDSSCHGLDLVGGLVLLVLLAGRRRSFIQVSQTA